ncbi:sulfite exporter TauE/SafE family protein, partial [Mycobacterium tuberculosis]|nr:sulfite exporter TauE/SafE family protein [Mycobacterium tuberculosis]
TLAGTFVLGTLISLIILAFNGQITSTQVTAAAAYFPLVVVGLIASTYLNRFIDRHLLNRIVIIVAICAALMLIAEAALF